MKANKTLFLAFTLLLTSCNGTSKIEEKSIDEIEQMIQDDESFVYYLGKETCSECDKLIKNFNKTNDLTLYYVDIKKFSKEEYNNQVLRVNSIVPQTHFDSQGYSYHSTNLYTPTLLKYIGGELVDGYVNAMSKDDIDGYCSSTHIKFKFYTNLVSYLDRLNCINQVYFYNSNDSESKKKIEELINTADLVFFYMDLNDITYTEKTDLLLRYNEQYKTSLDSLNSLNFFKIEI